MARVTWDFACVFVCFGSGILFVSLEKVFILALEGTRFPSLLAPRKACGVCTVIYPLVVDDRSKERKKVPQDYVPSHESQQ